ARAGRGAHAMNPRTLLASARAQGGFTLIELAVTAAIVSILALAVLPLAETAVKRARESELRVALRELRKGIDAYKKAWDEGRIEHRADASGSPPPLGARVEGVRDIRAPRGRRLSSRRRLPRAPFPAEPPPAGAWAKRSYASAPDFPAEGTD